MEKKRIVLISHNDTLGGAAIVTMRLMLAFRSLGYEADMLVFNKASSSPYVHHLGNSLSRSAKFGYERLGIYLNNGHNRADLFKVSTGSTGLCLRFNSLVRRADVIILSWINQATVSLDDIRWLAKSGKKVIWTMHDMWCMTGICHHAYGCKNFREECGDCKFLGPKAAPDDLSHRVWLKKKKLYDEADIQFVAVSNWLRDRARESSLLREKDVRVIHNPFPTELWPTEQAKPYLVMTRKRFRRVISFGAARLDDPVKGLDYAIDALNIVYDEMPEEAAGAVVVFFGSVSDPNVFNRLKFPHVPCGTLTDQHTLQHLYAASEIVLSTSLYECLPGTLIEGMSCGAVPVTFGEGGQTDIVDHKKTGYIARYLDARDIAEGIRWAFNAGIPRETLHQVVEDRFGARKIAEQYISLFS